MSDLTDPKHVEYLAADHERYSKDVLKNGKSITADTLRALSAELDLATRQRDEVWNEAIEAAAQRLYPGWETEPDSWTEDYARDCVHHAQNIRALKKPTGDKT